MVQVWTAEKINLIFFCRFQVNSEYILIFFLPFTPAPWYKRPNSQTLTACLLIPAKVGCNFPLGILEFRLSFCYIQALVSLGK